MEQFYCGTDWTKVNWNVYKFNVKSKSNHIASKLERMILKNNNLKKLPPKIGQVGRQLEFLDVSNNQLRKMPKSIYTLRGEVIKLNLSLKIFIISNSC